MAVIFTDADNAVINTFPRIMTQTRIIAWLQSTLVLFLLYTNSVNAGDWDFIPRISVAEYLTDNVNLDAEGEQADLITEISPGFSLHGEGGRLRADIDYQMQNLIFLKASDATGTNHQLNADATAELAKDLFFIDARSTAGQQIVNVNQTISNNNINSIDNRTDFITYDISPFLRSHFGGYADGVFRYTYGQAFYDDDRISDTTETSFDVGLVSGNKFRELSWTADYDYMERDRDTVPNQQLQANEQFENAEGTARYRLSNQFSLVGTGGYANNDFNTSTVIENGTYWSAGGLWHPNRYYYLEAQKGSNLETASVGLNPTRRTSLVVTYRNRTVGLNPGPAWFGTFRHYTRRTNWTARYFEDTTTQQNLLQQQGGVTFLGIDPITGETNPDPQPGDLVVGVPFDPVTSLTNEVMERKNASATFGMRAGKTGMNFRVFNEQRRFLTSLREEDTKGFSGSVNRRIAPRTNAVLTGTWQHISSDDDSRDTTYWFVQTLLTRQIRPKLNGLLSYTFASQGEDNNRIKIYWANTIEARLTAFF